MAGRKKITPKAPQGEKAKKSSTKKGAATRVSLKKLKKLKKL